MTHSLVSFAVPEESLPFLRWLRQTEACRIPAALVDDSSAPGRGNPRRVDVVVTGIGPRNAEQAFRRVLTGPSPARALTCGFAGGLNPDYPFGTVVFSADEDFDLTPALLAAGARLARFHRADRVILTATEKHALRRTTAADAVEMESGIIRAICKERGIPSATVRVISDAADEDLPLDFNRLMDADARFRYDRLAVALLKSPGRIRALIQMGFRTRRAARELASVLSSLFAP